MLALITMVALASAPVAERGCAEDAAPLRARVAAVREKLRNGAAEDEVETIDVVEPLRACFRRHVMPALQKAEADHTTIFAAAEEFYAWGREASLLSAFEAMEPEAAEGLRSLQVGIRHAFRVARDKCVRGDRSQADVMLRIARYAAMRSIEPSDDPGADFAACAAGWAYLVEVRQLTRTDKYGVTSEWRYQVMLRRDPDEPGSFVGRGIYGGHLVARGNCSNGNDKPQRFDVSGRIDATGAIVDMSADATKPEPHLMYTFASLDWPLKPMFGGDSPFAETAEEKEDVKGMGTIASLPPIRLTGVLTVRTDSGSNHVDKCAGRTTVTETVRVRRLAPR